MTEASLKELDELKTAWRALEQRLERQHTLELASFKRARMLDVRSALRPTVAGQFVQAVLGALLVVWFAAFWAEHRATPQLVGLGVFCQLWSIGLVALALRDLVTISQIDYAAPVVVIQKRIAELRARRTRAVPFYVVTGCVMWIPVALVVFHSIGGAELWANERGLVAWFVWLEKPEVVAWLLANCLVVPLLLLGVLRWLRDPTRAHVAKRFDDEVAGRSVVRAESMLAEIAKFEAD